MNSSLLGSELSTGNDAETWILDLRSNRLRFRNLPSRQSLSERIKRRTETLNTHQTEHVTWGSPNGGNAHGDGVLVVGRDLPVLNEGEQDMELRGTESSAWKVKLLFNWKHYGNGMRIEIG